MLPHLAQPLPRSHPRNRGNDNRPRGASPARRQRRRSRPVPGWLWLIAGLGAGMLITSLVKLSAVPPPAPAAVVAQPARPAPPPVERTPAEPAAADDSTATRFDFYTLLPEREVIVPDQREVAATAASTPKPVAAATPVGAAAPAPAAAIPAATGGETYLLQAGSFRGSTEAERRRAQIQALGLTARVEAVTAGGDTWYRVQAGPFTSPDTLASARDRLSGAGIETLLLRRKPAQ